MVRSRFMDLSHWMVRSLRMDLSAVLVLSHDVDLSSDLVRSTSVDLSKPAGSLLYYGSLEKHGSLEGDGSLPIRLDLVDMLRISIFKHIRHWRLLAELNLIPNLVQMR